MRLGLAFLVLPLAACGDVLRASSPASFPPATAAALQALLDDYALFTDGAGISLTVTHEGRTFDGAAGVANRVTRAPLQPGAQFRVGSNTKMALAIIATQLEAEGKLSLDDPLGKHVSGYPAWANITLRDLLAMRAGIPEYMRAQSLWLGFALDPRARREPPELLRGVEDAPLAYPPGTSCSYSNTSYLLVGLILEAVTRTSVKDLVRSRLSEPLGLAGTFMDTAGDDNPRLARGYLEVPTGASTWKASPLLYWVFNSDERLGNGLVDATDHFHPTLAGHAGALISTTADMTQVVAALGDGRLLAPAALDALQDYRACELNGREVKYGVGLFQLPTALGPAFGHGGLTFGYRTQTFHEPAHRVSFSIMTNYYPDQISAITDEMLTTVTGGPRGAAAAACAVPAGFFDDSDSTLRLRFRGRPGGAGIGRVTQQELSKVTPLHGGGLAARATADGGWVIETTTAGDGPRTRVRLEAGGAAVAALAAGGVVTFAPEDSNAPRLFVEELVTDANGETDACVMAVAEPFSRDGRLATCGGEDGVLRVFAQIRVSGREADVDEALVAARRERCQRIEELSPVLHVLR